MRRYDLPAMFIICLTAICEMYKIPVSLHDELFLSEETENAGDKKPCKSLQGQGRRRGARSADVFKIFYSESIIITAICFVLAMAASFVVCGVLNSELAGALGATIFVFGPLSWIVMLGIAVVTSFIATFLPVCSIAKRKPVESIRSL